MGNFNLAGILLTVGFFLLIVSAVLTIIDVTNPYEEFSIWEMIFEWISEAI